ncbi:MAG: hypothetical protein M1820_010253 [Bogoriella megaspora]|nr:MAG: hypothetical protein M1820_010253 [Bogoriella megaspora]
MRVLSSLAAIALAAASIAEARSLQHVGKKMPQNARSIRSPPSLRNPERLKRQAGSNTIIPQNANTTKFAVDGTAIPDVDFDIGESYAGLLPISSSGNSSELYFWFFPSSNVNASDEITIWLNGGPGCSSLEGLLQENGPFIWQYGTLKPVQNPWTWQNLTNMVWVEQPVGTGFSQGTPTARSEEDVAEQFLGFWKNFIDTFGLQNRKTYVTGESYAGQYVPYIADAMLNTNDTTYYDVSGILIYDPSVADDTILEQIPAVPFLDYWGPLIPLNSSYNDYVHQKAESCGYNAYLEKYLVYPSAGQQPDSPDLPGNSDDCDVFDDIFNAALEVNPCFDIYQVATTCPLLYDVLGFPGSIPYLPDGGEIYFNRTDVQKAINAPLQEWEECADGVLTRDTSLPSSLTALPRVIERTNNVILAHGLLDMILIANGSALAIQNMTWNGARGFETKPSDEFFVPYHNDPSLSTLTAAGAMGTTHTERGFTFVTTALSGHMVPQYQPSAAYRQLEFLLGRISSLTERSDFTTQSGSGNFGNGAGNATMKVF